MSDRYVALSTQEKRNYLSCLFGFSLLTSPPFLTLDSVPHCCSPAEMTIAWSDICSFGPHDLSCVDFAPSRRWSGLNGIRLSSKNCRFTVILTLTSPHFISSPRLSRVFSAKEATPKHSRTMKSETSPVYFTKKAMF